MKNLCLIIGLLLMITMNSCTKNHVFDPDAKKENNTFDFSTRQAIHLDVNYASAGTKVLFELYEENPVVFLENAPGYHLKEGVEPLFAAWTDVDGKYQGEVDLPAYLSHVYVYSNAFYASRLLEGEVVNGRLAVSDQETDTKAIGTRAKNYSNTSYRKGRFKKLGWNTRGKYDAFTGKIEYTYQGTDAKLTLSKEEKAVLSSVVATQLPTATGKVCPEYLRTQADMEFVKDAEITLIALGGGTCWNSSLGYYFYPVGQTPKSLKEVQIYTIFPNTQDGSWKQNGITSKCAGLERGETVQLMFYDKDHPEGTTVFPKGYKIGFVLATNAWDNYFSGFSFNSSATQYYACSTKGLSSSGGGLPVHTAMFQYENNMVISFEDYKDDKNFGDVAFTLKSNPVDAIPDLPVVGEKYTTVYNTSVYAFEDMWPSHGDYDMNDVVVQYTYGKTFDSDNAIQEESFLFKTFANEANFNNGLAFVLDKNISGTYRDSIRIGGEGHFTSTEFDHSEGSVVKLTKNVKDQMNAEYKVTLFYNEGKKENTSADVFIYRPSGDLRMEVHCPYLPPTDQMDKTLFGKGDDATDLSEAKPAYYTSWAKNAFPYAFQLYNARQEDIAPLIDPSNEKKRIDQLYPDFIKWSKSGGTECKDWYKNKN